MKNVSPATTTDGSQRGLMALWIAGDLYALGNWVLLVILVARVYQVEELASQVSLVVLALMAPPLLLGLVGRALVDRGNSQMAAIAAHLLTALPVFSLLGLKANQDAQTLVIIALLAAIPVAFARIAHGELLAALVPSEYAAAAEKAVAGTRVLTMVLGPSLAFVLMIYASYQAAVGVTLFLLLVSTAVVAVVRPSGSSAKEVRTSAEAGHISRLGRGLSTVFSVPGLRSAMAVRAGAALVMGGLLVVEMAFVVWGITVSAEHIGVLLATQGFGVVLGTLVYNRLRNGFSSNAGVAGGLGVVAGGVFGLAISGSLPASLAFCAMIGLGSVFVALGLTYTAGKIAPESARAGVSSALDTAAELMVLLSVLATGLIADALKPRYTLVLIAILLAVLALYAFGALEENPEPREQGEQNAPDRPSKGVAEVTTAAE